MIVMDDSQAKLEQLFTGVRKAGRVYDRYSMPYNHFDIYYCSGMRRPLPELWPRVKKWN